VAFLHLFRRLISPLSYTKNELKTLKKFELAQNHRPGWFVNDYDVDADDDDDDDEVNDDPVVVDDHYYDNDCACISEFAFKCVGGIGVPSVCLSGCLYVSFWGSFESTREQHFQCARPFTSTSTSTSTSLAHPPCGFTIQVIYADSHTTHAKIFQHFPRLRLNWALCQIAMKES